MQDDESYERKVQLIELLTETVSQVWESRPETEAECDYWLETLASMLELVA